MSINRACYFHFFHFFICILKNTAAIVRKRPSRFGPYRVRKMKYLSFIAVLFYLSLLFPTAGHSASSSWVDLQQANKNFSLALVAPSTHSTVDSTETSGDDEKSPVSWNSFEFPVAHGTSYQWSQSQFSTAQKSCYPARAPPLHLA